jgi:hypothetical protein
MDFHQKLPFFTILRFVKTIIKERYFLDFIHTTEKYTNFAKSLIL